MDDETAKYLTKANSVGHSLREVMLVKELTQLIVLKGLGLTISIRMRKILTR